MGEEALAQIQRLVREGSVRRVVVMHPDGHTIVEFPLLISVVGAALAPVWAALGAVLALVTDCTMRSRSKLRRSLLRRCAQTYGVGHLETPRNVAALRDVWATLV
jgi:hypothetical protein